MASRSQSYKKSSVMDKRDKRLLRVHRRSLDQREMRQDEVNKRRQLDDMSPVIESRGTSQNPSCTATPVIKKGAVNRLEQLKKWKDQKELKRKLESLERGRFKPGFKVVHLEHKDKDIFQHQKTATVPSTKAVASSSRPTVATSVRPTRQPPVPRETTTRAAKKAIAPPKTASKPSQAAKKAAQPVQAAPTARPTRSRVAAIESNPKSRTKAKPSPKKESAGLGFMAPTAASKTRAVPKTKTVLTKPVEAKKTSVAPKPRGKAAAPKVATKNAGAVKEQKKEAEESSFAPNNFTFQAPNNVSSFVFTPLSPSSAAVFLFPNSGNSSSLSAFTDRVGRTSTPKRDGKRASGLQRNTSEDKPATSDAQQSPNNAPADDAAELSGNAKSAADSGIEVSIKESGAGRGSPKEQVAGVSAVDEDGDAQQNQQSTETTKVEVKETVTHSGPNRRRQSRRAASQDEEMVTATGEKQTLPKSRRGSRRSGASNAEKRRSSAAMAEPGAQEDAIPVDVASEETAEAAETATKKSRKGRKSRYSQMPSMDVVMESQSAGEDSEVFTEDAEAKTSTDGKDQADGSAKKRRRSRRSVARQPEDTAETEPSDAQHQEVVGTDITAQADVGSAKKRRQSRRSVAKQPEEDMTESDPKHQEVVGTDITAQADVGSAKKRRQSRRSVTKQPEEHMTESDPTHKDVVGTDITAQTDVGSAKKRRQSRRSVAKQSEESISETDPSSDTKQEEVAGTTKKVTLAEVMQTESLLPRVATPECKQRGPRVGKTHDDLFLTPGPPVSSRKHSAKRRRTATMIALSSATSPEEAIKIISTSPMVEMNRRTPKSKTSPDLRKNVTAALFDDDFEADLALSAVKPTRLSAVFDEADLALSAVKPTRLSAVFDATTEEDVAALSTADAVAEPVTSSDTDTQAVPEKRDVEVFRQRLVVEVTKLTQLSDHWTDVKSSSVGLSEEVAGEIDTMVCYAQLLMGRKGKFTQYAGLVDKCEEGDPGTTCQDLQGFQDMIFIQAEDIYSKFSQLERRQQNNWEPESTSEAALPKPAKKIVKFDDLQKAAIKKKPAVKSKFAAFRAQMQQQKAQEETPVLAEPAPVPAAQEKVFDAGFFKVASPVRSPAFHCEGGTPTKRRSSGVQESQKTPSSAASGEAPPSAPSTPSAPSAPTTPPVAVDNKENVAHALLRRSAGFLSGRRSYVPAVPSPLLRDGTPSSSRGPASAEAAAASAMEVQQEGPQTPKRPRKSMASRKSVCFAEEVKAVSTDSGDKGQSIDLSAYFQPSALSASPLQESALDNSPFSSEDILRHSDPATPSTAAAPSDSQQQSTTGGRRKSSLKVLPTKQRRQSRRSVNFALSPRRELPSPGMALPATPYNRDSLVAGKRVSRHSGSDESILEELQTLRTPPPTRRSARPSLLYTPPPLDKSKPKTPVVDVPVAKLISFSP